MLCARCAVMSLRTRFIVRNGRFPLSMEEVIAAELLGQIDGSLPVNPIPEALIEPEAVCARCKSHLGLRGRGA